MDLLVFINIKGLQELEGDAQTFVQADAVFALQLCGIWLRVLWA